MSSSPPGRATWPRWRLLREAGRAAAHRAPASAERWFTAALRLLPESAPAEERVELFLARSGALAATGRFTDSHAVLLEGLALVPPDAVGLRVRLVAACAGVEHLLGRHAQAHARLERALDELGDPESTEAFTLMVELAVDGLYRGAYDEMRRWAARADEAAALQGDRVLDGSRLALRAVSAALSGATDEAHAQREEAAALVDVLSDDELAGRLDALTAPGDGGDVPRPLRAVRPSRGAGPGDRASDRPGRSLPADLPDARNVALGAGPRGRGGGGVRRCHRGRTSPRQRAGCRLESLQPELRGRRRRGRRPGARHGRGELRARAGELDESVLTGHAAWALAVALLETGRAADAAELLLRSAGGDELRVIPGGWRATGLELLTRCLLAAGRRAEAEQAAAAAAACAEEVGLPMATAMASLAGAAVDLGDGRAEAAAEQALDAAVALEGVADASYGAAARMLAGRALAAAGERDRAAAELERALTAFESFPAPRATSPRPSSELRKLGRTVHRRSARGTADGRPRRADRARAAAGAARRRPQDEPPDRGRALPQPEDRRDAPSQHLPQGRRLLARRARPRRRARRAQPGDPAVAP